MITGTIDCNADEQANTARGVQRNLDMFKVLTFMFFHAGMKENADVGGSWLSLRKHDVKQRGSLVKVKRSSAPPSLSSFGISQRQTDRQTDTPPGELNTSTLVSKLLHTDQKKKNKAVKNLQSKV